MDFAKLLQVGRWLEPFPGSPSAIYLVAVAAFVVWTIACMVLYIGRRRIFAGRGALIGMTKRLGGYAIAIGWVGLFFLAMRYLAVPYLDVRFLLYLTILAAIGYLGFIAYYVRRHYPTRVAEVKAHDLRRRYAPTPKRKKRRR